VCIVERFSEIVNKNVHLVSKTLFAESVVHDMLAVLVYQDKTIGSLTCSCHLLSFEQVVYDESIFPPCIGLWFNSTQH